MTKWGSPREDRPVPYGVWCAPATALVIAVALIVAVTVSL